MPDLQRAREVGIGTVITSAMNQAFFTLSLGIGAMEIFGSYMPREHTLAGESMRICALDTFVALMAGMIIDNFGWSRKKAAWLNCIFILIASLPCVLGYNLWSDLHIIGARDVLDSEDFLVSNLLLPVGSLIYLLFCVTRWGWGFDQYLKETNTGNGLRLPGWLKKYFQFILPALILIILIQGLI